MLLQSSSRRRGRWTQRVARTTGSSPLSTSRHCRRRRRRAHIDVDDSAWGSAKRPAVLSAKPQALRHRRVDGADRAAVELHLAAILIGVIMVVCQFVAWIRASKKQFVEWFDISMLTLSEAYRGVSN